MQITIQIRGGSDTVRGTPCGPFLIHKPLGGIDLGDWTVSHRKTGLRFPCSFLTREDARKFAKEVQSVMDFEAIEVAAPTGRDFKCEWTKGAPTVKQKEKVKKLMKKFGV
jgi:hypothetical protein